MVRTSSATGRTSFSRGDTEMLVVDPPITVRHSNSCATTTSQVQRPVWLLATLGTSPVHARPVEAPTSRFDSRGCPVHRHPRPRAEEAGPTSSTRLLQLAGVERLPRAMNEIWYQGSETPRSGRRVTRVVGQAARGALEHASARPLSSTLCALRAQAIDAAQGQPGREGRR